ncbi:MAG: acyl-CoA dehydrogenase [Burkholderiales bacterium]|nr:acyl-CoA dehydrogenase [Burkholderiales bacterium]
MASKLLSRRDAEFILYEWLDTLALTQRERFSDHSRDTFDAALDTAERIATDHFYPINPTLDADEPRFDGQQVHTPAPLARALDAFGQAGLIAAAHDYEYGGMQLPYSVERVCFAYFAAASVSAAAYPMLTAGNANLLLAHGSAEQIERWVRPMLAGRYFGTMCLSEPQAGSSLADIRTRAESQPDGSYRITGNKMWISAGEHELAENIVHLVLAKIPGPDGALPTGVGGISLFVVPKWLPAPDASHDGGTASGTGGNPSVQAGDARGERNDIALAGLNHKMGYRGTTNCLLNFGEGRFTPGGRAGAVGWLVGQPQRGLACMFHMMNEARIAVGMGATALGYTGYLHALDYARNRPQGRRIGQKDPASPQVPIVAHADVRRMLLAQKAYAEGAFALNLFCARLVDDERTHPDAAQRQAAHRLLELLTPVAKSWPSQWCLDANELAIQVHGGYGYTRDYRVEQFYRDNRLNPIHEGTHGIQALDLLGRKLRADDGRALAELHRRIDAAIAQAQQAGDEWAAAAQSVAAAGRRLAHTIARLETVNDAERRLANASAFLEAFGHHVMAWIWLEQALVAQAALQAGADGEARDFYLGKQQAARYFLRWELPKIDALLDRLDEVDATTLDMRDEWF